VKLASLVLVLAVCALGFAACEPDRPGCYSGEYRACVCDAGATGYQQCLATQDGYAACVCNGITPVADAGAESGVAPGSRQFMESCTADADCVTHLCGLFPSRGNKCSKPCTANSDCPPPSPGCNPQAICKSP
jgi:hypothetical protein